MVQGARYRVQGCSRRRLRLRLRECGDECVGSELLQGAGSQLSQWFRHRATGAVNRDYCILK